MRSLTASRATLGGPASTGTAASAARRIPRARLSLSQWFVLLLWFVMLCDPQWLLAKYLPDLVLQVPTGLFGIFLLMFLARGTRDWYVPLLLFFLYTAANLPLAYNPARALVPTKQMLLFYLLAVGTLAYVRQPRQALPFILLFFVGQHLWWVVHGAMSGRVTWHPTNTNFDNFGPQMVIGLPAAYYFAMSTRSKRLKMLALAAAAGCIVGTIASFARGAVVSAAAVLFWVWFRSPRKGWTTIAMAGAAAIVLLVGGLLFVSERRGGGVEKSFFAEMMTIGSEEDATEDDRMVLWTLATRIFLRHPVLGVGAENFGPYAAENFEVGEVGGAYDENPGRLYDRQIHSTFFQMLCEYGVVGCLLFAWLFWHFWRRNKALRNPAHISAWDDATGGVLDLKQLSLGLECAMVSYLTTGFFYNQIFLPWLWSILAFNALLFALTRPPRRASNLRARAA